jgi:hypothetical protein
MWLKSHITNNNHRKGCVTMLWTIFAVILILWGLGFAFDVAGGLIHILLVLAAISLIFNLFSSRRSR